MRELTTEQINLERAERKVYGDDYVVSWNRDGAYGSAEVVAYTRTTTYALTSGLHKKELHARAEVCALVAKEEAK